jgi:4-methylaminobutanoate oxidase (formaldehyde-forming)
VLEDPEPMLWSGELLLRDGRPAGQVTSAAWGASVGAAVGLGYVRHVAPVTADWLAAGEWSVDVAGERHVVLASLRAPGQPQSS